MPFDPNFPPDRQPLVSAPFRDQFNSLDAKIADCATQVSLNDAINAGSAGNCDGVAELNLTVSSPPTQAQMQAIADKQDELIRALKRV